jgi:hypothetical protein
MPRLAVLLALGELDSKPGQRISRKQRSAAGNAVKLLGVTDGIPTWRRGVRSPSMLAKNATQGEAAVEYRVRRTA